MEAELKQRNRRRKRAQRMHQQQQRQINDNKNIVGDSEDDNNSKLKEEKKYQRPLLRRKKKESLVEEDIIEGFSILQFRTYEDLELVVKISSKENIKHLADIERPKLLDTTRNHIHHISIHNNHTKLTNQDPATSDDSGRASERLTGSSVAPRDADSSRDRLSDASSRCSSGKGYICDSEGDDDKNSDASSVIFASTPSTRKQRDFPPGALLPSSLPLISNGTSNSPVPAPTPPNLPVPSPAPAQQPALSSNIPQKNNDIQASPPMTTVTVAAPTSHLHTVSGGSNMRTNSPAIATSANIPAPPPRINGGAGGGGTGVGDYHPYMNYNNNSNNTLYAPYAIHSQYSNSATNTCTTSANSVTMTTASVTQPHGHSPLRDSYSSVSSLSRSSIPTPNNNSNNATVSSSNCSSLVLNQKPTWSAGLPASQLSPANSAAVQAVPPRPTPPPPPPPALHSSYPSLFTASHPSVAVSTAAAGPNRTSPLAPPAAPQQTPNPNPFSAESLFQTNQTDMLRRELDNRFLATSHDRTSLGIVPPVPPPPYLRTEMHQHQHHHTHVHQHTTSLLPPPASSSLFPSPLSMSAMERLTRRNSNSSFKDMTKLSNIESPFYRQNITSLPNYPGYPTSGLLHHHHHHPGLATGATPFVQSPNHLTTFQPKSMSQDPNKPKIVLMKTGKWNAMHVRVAWEIYHHQQQKNGTDTKPGSITASASKSATDLLRHTSSHLYPSSLHAATMRHDLPPSFPPPPTLAAHHHHHHRQPNSFDHTPHSNPLFSSAQSAPHLGSTLSPFTRYGAVPSGVSSGSFANASPFAGIASPYGSTARDLPPPLVGPLGHHDPWRNLARNVTNFPPPPSLNSIPPPTSSSWNLKAEHHSSSILLTEQREREAIREREEREREKLKREREDKERREREEKQRRLEQQQQQEREREKREKERREMERRELIERERLMQHRIIENDRKIRDRSPILTANHNTNNNNNKNEAIRIKEESRIKDELTAESRYHSYLRQLQQPPHQSRLLPHNLTTTAYTATTQHPSSQPPSSHWPPPPPPSAADSFYRNYNYNSLMDVIRIDDKLFSTYGPVAPPPPSSTQLPGLPPPPPHQLRQKDSSGLMHLRPGPGPPSASTLPLLPIQASSKLNVTPPIDLFKKEELR